MLFGKRKKNRGAGGPPSDQPASRGGWEALERAFGDHYGGQRPRWWEHHGVHRMDDLRDPPENPLEAVALYDAGQFWHYVSFGMSDLFERVSEDEWSGFGYELTFRLGKEAEPEPPLWPVDVMTSLAKAAHGGAGFAAGHTIKTGPIDGDADTRLTALLVVRDPAIELLETPNGKVALLLLVGVEGAVRERALEIGVDQVVRELSARDRDLATRR